MKKILYSVIALTMAAFTFTSCEDVPAPYDDPNNNGGGQELPEGVLLDQNFTSSLGDFKSVAASGDLNWYNDFSSAMVTGYQDFNGDGQKENKPGVTFLVGPEIDFTDVTEAHITINHALNYERGDINANNSIVISKDYAGDVTTATWQVLDYNTDGLGNSFTFVENNVNIPAEYMGGKAVIALRHTCSETQSSTWEVKSLKVQEGKVDEEQPSTPEEPSGDGTLQNPYNVAGIIAYTSTLGENETSDKEVYIKGTVKSIKENFDGGFGNATFYITDGANGSNQFYIYRTLYLGNQKYTSGELLKEGDEVIVHGKVTNYVSEYGSTLETVQNQSYVYSINGNTGSGEEPSTGVAKGDGSLANPFNAVAANEYASKLPADGVSEKEVYIKGKIASIRENFTAQYGNASFYISDDGSNTNTFYVFRTLYLNNVKYTEGTLPQVGDDVIICGKVTNYKGNTPETMQNQSYIYSLTSNGGGDTPDVPENSITLIPSELGLANASAVENVTLSDGTVLTFDGGGNQNPPKYYNAGTNIRMYPKNSVTIKASKKIAQVIIKCDTYQGVICNASGDVAANPGNVETKDAVITVNGVNSAQTTISNISAKTGTASQIRMTALTIVYAE